VPGAFGKGIERLCGVLAAPTARELRRLLALALRETRTAEIRLDWLKNDAERRAFLKWLKAHCPRKAQLIATCRRAGWRRGIREGDAGEELYWLMQARAARLRVVRPGSGNASRVAGEKRGRLCGAGENSAFDARFSENAGVSQEARPCQPWAAPLRSRLPRWARVCLIVLAFCGWLTTHTTSLAIAMGEIGLPARVLALREGSALAYAPVATATARPGRSRCAI